MDEKLIKESIILSYIFSFFNASLIIYSQIFVKSNDNFIRMLKFKIFLLIAIDSFMIAFKIIYNNFLDEINYEILNTFLFSLQFYEFISYIFDIFTHIFQIKEYEIMNSFIMSFICYLLIFPYSQFLYSYNIYIFITQIISRAICIICLYYYLNNITKNISNDEGMATSKLNLNKNISLLINFCLIALLVYDFLKFGILFFNNFHYNLALFSSNIAIKYIIFNLIIIIISMITKFDLNTISKGNNNTIINK